jgi:acetyltransferase-like isoleucine patch superfamily enzyme
MERIVAFKQGEYYVDDGGNEFDIKGILDKRPNISGKNNRIIIEEASNIRGMVELIGDNNKLVIGRHSYMAAGSIISFIRSDNCKLEIGNNTTIADGTAFQFHETAEIVSGRDCMFSSGCLISVSDMHPIYDSQSNERINPAKDIVFGDHVWLGWRSYVGKGSVIGSGAVIGAMSFVTGTIPPGVIAAGNPPRVIKENVRWERDFRRS